MTCDECVGGINASVDQLLSEEFIAGIVEWLSGVEFCGVDEDPEMCANIIHQLIPAALPALAAGFDPENASDICNKAVSDTCIGEILLLSDSWVGSKNQPLSANIYLAL